ANQNLVAHAQFNLKNLSLNVGEESQFRVNLVLNSPNGQQYEKVYTIVAYRPEDLEAPIVSMASEPPQQVEQGKDFLLSLKVDLAGSVGELTDTEQVLRDQIGEDWQGNIECEMVVG